MISLTTSPTDAMKAIVYRQDTPTVLDSTKKNPDGSLDKYFKPNIYQVGEVVGTIESCWKQAKLLTRNPGMEWKP